MGSWWHQGLHPKTLFEIAMVLSTNSGSFPSNSHVSATFSILLRFGESWVSTNCEKFNAVTGRRWAGRILINLCGNNNVRNCDLLQSDFFDRCRTVVRVAKGFFWRVWWNLEKDEAPKRCDFLRLRNMLLKATFPSSYLGLVEATPAAKKKWVFLGTAC